MPSLELAQALLAPETQKALSLRTVAPVFGAVSQAETVMEIVDRVYDRYFCGAVKTATSKAAWRVQRELPILALDEIYCTPFAQVLAHYQKTSAVVIARLLTMRRVTDA